MTFSNVVRDVVDDYCKSARMSYDQLAALMNVPTMTLRRFTYDTIITEPSSGEEIKNPNHVNITMQKLMRLYDITQDARLIEYLPQKYGAVIIWQTEKKKPTCRIIRHIIRRLTKVCDWIEDGQPDPARQQLAQAAQTLMSLSKYYGDVENGDDNK